MSSVSHQCCFLLVALLITLMLFALPAVFVASYRLFCFFCLFAHLPSQNTALEEKHPCTVLSSNHPANFPSCYYMAHISISWNNVIIYWWSINTCSCFVTSYLYRACPGALISDWQSIRNRKDHFEDCSHDFYPLFHSRFLSAHLPILVVLLHWFIHSGFWIKI